MAFHSSKSPVIHFLIKNITRYLKVKAIPTTNVLELKYADKNADLAACMLNAISQAMLEENIKNIYSEVKKVRQFLEKIELPRDRICLKLPEAAENRYRQKGGIVSFNEQSRNLVESLTVLEQEERSLISKLPK